jgi:hypothetical protein
VLRREAVFDRDHRQIELARNFGSKRGMGGDIAGNKAAAVVEHHYGAGLALAAPIEQAQADRSARAGHGQLAVHRQLAHRQLYRRHHLRHGLGRNRPHHLDPFVAHRRARPGHEPLEESGDIGAHEGGFGSGHGLLRLGLARHGKCQASSGGKA